MNNELQHFGVLGMHWGVRRYQNPDGTLTDLGKEKRAKASSASDVSSKVSKASKLTGVASSGTALAAAVATGALIVGGVITGPIGQIGLVAAATAGAIGAGSTLITAGANVVKKYNDVKVSAIDDLEMRK